MPVYCTEARVREIVRMMFQEYDGRLGVVLTRAQEIESGLVNKTAKIDCILTNTREQVLYVHNQLLEVEPRHLAMDEKIGLMIEEIKSQIKNLCVATKA